MRRRYCEMCDIWVSTREVECRRCGAETSKPVDYCAACDAEGATAGGDTRPLESHTCRPSPTLSPGAQKDEQAPRGVEGQPQACRPAGSTAMGKRS